MTSPLRTFWRINVKTLSLKAFHIHPRITTTCRRSAKYQGKWHCRRTLFTGNPVVAKLQKFAAIADRAGDAGVPFCRRRLSGAGIVVLEPVILRPRAPHRPAP